MNIEPSLQPSYFNSEAFASELSGDVDFYALDDLLTPEERQVRDRVRAFSTTEIIPTIAEYWEHGQYPFELLAKMGSLHMAGGTIKGYGCPEMSRVAVGLLAAELTRGDGGFHISFGVHSVLAMPAIAHYGSEDLKTKWLPQMARLEKIGAFAATEAEHGSDVIAMETRAYRDGDSWVLRGEKKWIGNASFADVIVLWARTETGQVSAFLVEKDMPGLSTRVIQGKLAARTSWQAHILLENVRVPASNHLSKVQSFNDMQRLVNMSRYSIAWSAVGQATACYEYALAYARNRQQFGKSLAHFQLVQQKLARMLADLTAMQFLCWRLGRLIEAGKATTGMVSLAKMQTILRGRQVVADARDILGGNGLLIENHVARHFADMEVLSTVEGTDHLQALTLGREITGVQAIL